VTLEQSLYILHTPTLKKELAISNVAMPLIKKLARHKTSQFSFVRMLPFSSYYGAIQNHKQEKPILFLAWVLTKNPQTVIKSGDTRTQHPSKNARTNKAQPFLDQEPVRLRLACPAGQIGWTENQSTKPDALAQGRPKKR
jgi:hypothetical protein